MQNATKRTKRMGLLALLLVAALALTGCSGSNDTAAQKTTNTIPVVINQAEYTLNQNVFYNGYGPQIEGTKVTKQGVFTRLTDTYSGITRYYVWGYLDQTLCCDWQWEFKPSTVESSELPPDGSLITVSGTFTADDRSLDGYWITSAKVETVTEYTGETADLNLRTMDGTLERVQLSMIQYRTEKFEDKSVIAYGRIYDMGHFQDPYYDGSWTYSFTTEEEVPAIGTSVILRGTMKEGVVTGAKIEVTD